MLRTSEALAPMPVYGATLRPGHVALFRFPCAEAHTFVEPDRRAWLALWFLNRGGHVFVEFSDGASANTGDEFCLVEPEDAAHPGVGRPTRCICMRCLMVTPCHPVWNTPPRHPSPIVGSLPPAAKRWMNANQAEVAVGAAVAGHHGVAWSDPSRWIAARGGRTWRGRRCCK